MGKIIKFDFESPTLLAYPREDGAGLKAWCPYCACWHLHGKGDGHRVAHCDPESGSAFLESGYFLKEV